MKKTLSFLQHTLFLPLALKTRWLLSSATGLLTGLLIVFATLTPLSALIYAEESSIEEENPAKEAIDKHYNLPDIENKRSQLLLEHMSKLNRENEVVMLHAEESFYGLFLAEESGNPQGAVLILPDLQQHGHWPVMVAPLREYLPQFGWATLTIELPYPPAKARIPRDKASTELTQEADTEVNIETTPQQAEVVAAYQKQTQARINAAVNYLKSRNQLNLVIVGYGASASWAIDYAHKETGKGLTLITIDALNNSLAPENIQQQIEKIQVPYLDLIQPNQQPVQRLAQQRLKIMRRTDNTNYQQITTANIANYKSLENSTTRRIRGWLMTHAGGKLINRAR